MGMIGGLDVHRAQITFDLLDPGTGEARRGEIRPATRENLRDWLNALEVDEAEFALEATTGWRFAVEEIERAGYEAHLAEPADTRALRGKKRRAKTNRADARHLRELLQTGRLPESWIPPAHIAELRARVRLRKALVDERTAWQQRAHAILFHNGLPQKRNLLTRERRAWLEAVELPEASRASIDAALRMIDHINEELAPIDAEIRRFAGRQVGCRALQRHYGFGPITSAAILAEFGDIRRFSRSRHAVRHTGLDVTVHESDGKRAPGKLSRQGAPLLRWALFESAQLASRTNSPDHAYYLDVKSRLGANRAALAVARKLARRAYHTLRALGDEALEPVA